MALLGGVYIPCVIALLPDKTRETYDVFFGLIYDYLDKHNLPNNFSDGFFMTDFEINIRFNDTRCVTVSQDSKNRSLDNRYE